MWNKRGEPGPRGPRDVEGREGEVRARRESRCTPRKTEGARGMRNGDRTRLVGLDGRRRVNTEAPRRFTTPRCHGRCLTYPRLSGTQAIFTAGRVTTTRATSARDACRDALRGGRRWQKRRSKLQTRFRMSNDVISSISGL